MSFYMYKLVDGKPVPCEDFNDHLVFMQTQDRFIRRTEVIDNFVSSVFLCVDHSYDDSGLFFETMSFLHGDWAENSMCRYYDIDSMIAEHPQFVEELQCIVQKYGTWRRYKKKFSIGSEFNKAGREFKWHLKYQSNSV